MTDLELATLYYDLSVVLQKHEPGKVADWHTENAVDHVAVAIDGNYDRGAGDDAIEQITNIILRKAKGITS